MTEECEICSGLFDPQFMAFEDVTPDEKVWICEECFLAMTKNRKADTAQG